MFALVCPCACLSVCHALPALFSRLYNCTQSVPLTIIGISYFYQRSANSHIFCYIDNYFTSLGCLRSYTLAISVCLFACRAKVCCCVLLFFASLIVCLSACLFFCCSVCVALLSVCLPPCALVCLCVCLSFACCVCVSLTV